MKYCTNCGGEIDGEVEGDIVVCPNCGMPVKNLTNMDVPTTPQHDAPKPIDDGKKKRNMIISGICIVIAAACFTALLLFW